MSQHPGGENADLMLQRVVMNGALERSFVQRKILRDQGISGTNHA